ncbi:Uncharacterised protein [Enterobacter hormaechei]|nr:Uncharacterised protein [Enterobacter hormaechei]VAF38327.1 Uncharacterised protein [Enterobacter hormaechei]
MWQGMGVKKDGEYVVNQIISISSYSCTPTSCLAKHPSDSFALHTA